MLKLKSVLQRETGARENTSRRRHGKGRVNFRKLRHAAQETVRFGLNQYQLRLNSKLLKEVTDAFNLWLAEYEDDFNAQWRSPTQPNQQDSVPHHPSENDLRQGQNQAARLLTDFLLHFSHQRLLDLRRLRNGNKQFRNTIAKVRDEDARRAAILQYAADLGASPKQISGDAKAFSRWFDEEAVTDRFAKRVGHTELLLAFVFDRLSVAVDDVITMVYRNDNHASEGRKPNEYESLIDRLEGVWSRLDIENRLHDAITYEGDARVQAAALKCLSIATNRLPQQIAQQRFSKRTVVLLHRIAIEARTDVWVQCHAFAVLANLNWPSTLPIVLKRLQHPRAGDDMFVRRHLYKMLTQRIQAGESNDTQLPSYEDEPSEFVRQAFCQTAFLSRHAPTRRQWSNMALHDKSLQVRAAALLVGTQFPSDTRTTIDFLQVVQQVLSTDKDPFVLRTAMHVVKAIVVDATSRSPDESIPATSPVSDEELRRESVVTFYQQRIESQLVRLQHGGATESIRRWAAQTREACWAATDPASRDLLQKLRFVSKTIGIGRTKRLPKKWFAEFDDAKLGRVFAVLAQDDFGYDIHRGLFGVHVTRGPVFGFRLWRMIFEFTHTATDKRQALRHTVGRINSAGIRAPSQILGELSETKVPGEPVTIASDSTWRPFLPLVDDFISILNRSWLFPRKTTFFSSQGVTEVTGPRGLLRCLHAAYRMNFRFQSYAAKRNWDDDTFPSSSYIEDIQRLGFQINFTEFDPRSRESVQEDTVDQALAPAQRQDEQHATPIPSVVTTDQTVTRFFTPTLCASPLLAGTFIESASQMFNKYADYFQSAYENTLPELVVFTTLILLVILVKHFWANYTFRNARRNIPLSIGGWGTRGKSGTERLKAALIGAMGHGLVSKTTGCEAMFIHGDPNGEPLEIPLFRPFDKATIWEQHNLIQMASRMNPSVFLWECMALTPSYVDVLQRQWTTDDLGTITNTYPDHEDLQGPAGHNVATTISGFVPERSHMITTEQVMRPYISESCRLAETTLRGVGWLESGLVTEDVLDRFPYKEHPDNVALVSAMGDELGLDYDFCVKAMGDYLVPDLGVLKTHPISTVRTRRIEFTNGMSANERFGCMGNIRRLGFDTQDPWTEPATWVCGVVNNRADRVPRSKVFAKIIVDDMNADRFFLIGSNLKGLVGFIEEAWEQRGATITLCDQGKPWDASFALQTLKQAAWDFRQSIEPEQITAKLSVMLTAVNDDTTNDVTIDVVQLNKHWESPDKLREALSQAGVPVAIVEAIYKHQTEALAGMHDYQAMVSKITSGSPSALEQIESDYKQMLKRWYMQKLVVVDNFDATGEEVVETIVDETPPGFLNRTIGLQNIKGTGLDFVYRFQAWDFCHEACEAMQSPKTQVAQRGLQALLAMPAIGQLCQNRMREVIETAKTSNALRRPDLQTQLGQLMARLSEATDHSQQHDDRTVNDTTDKSKGARLAEWNQWMIDTSEEAIDLNDSLRRRDNADRIYKDLAAQRISRQRAVVELRKINKRQKGGWLTSKLKSK